MTSTFALRCAAIVGATGVALGAYGAHGLKKFVPEPEKVEMWGTASRYQLIHAAALLAISASGRRSLFAPVLWTAGTLMFSGSIYCLVLDNQRFKALGPVTPLGGLLLIAGWLSLLAP
ncbi:DUF423-domain-containing protein [Coemansia reversa NRRL 1564]|uniref:DUF423-domain-containing protein n=1 Tax=Coemansia reversa (strain ATCC 12441 / NRRL 1564) TaxID=763665 RepID=A0A2G5B6U0_COERN|nr:DUF423-domain-containing protein [Coemansia reversa NRRL 1564]|eukprot:PIA14711.1 DUF423-domain-containing protein [Coemansia reversa NRRL 1564]